MSDVIIKNLQVISELNVGDKLGINSDDNIIYISSSSFSRIYYKENRNTSFIKINNVITEALGAISGSMTRPEYKRVPELLLKCMNEGLVNLKETYSNDLEYVVKMENLIHRINGSLYKYNNRRPFTYTPILVLDNVK